MWREAFELLNHQHHCQNRDCQLLIRHQHHARHERQDLRPRGRRQLGGQGWSGRQRAVEQVRGPVGHGHIPAVPVPDEQDRQSIWPVRVRPRSGRQLQRVEAGQRHHAPAHPQRGLERVQRCERAQSPVRRHGGSGVGIPIGRAVLLPARERRVGDQLHLHRCAQRGDSGVRRCVERQLRQPHLLQGVLPRVQLHLRRRCAGRRCRDGDRSLQDRPADLGGRRGVEDRRQ